MYITKYIVLGQEGNLVKIYSPCENSILLASNDLLILLDKLREKYNNDPISEADPLFTKLLSIGCFEKLKAAHFITDELGAFERTFENKYHHVSISEIYLHVTQECNLRCTYCYARHNLGKNMMMTPNLANRVIDEIANVTHIVLTGGEPLLNPQINDIIKCIRERTNARITLLTNGTLIRQCIDTLDRVDNIIVSLDVGESQNRKGLDATKVLEYLEYLPHRIKEKTSVRSVISPGEELLIPKMKKQIKSMNLEYITVPQLPNSPEDITSLPDMALLTDLSEPTHNYRPTRCGAGTTIIAIDWNGDIYPCQSLIKKDLKMGSILDSEWHKQLETSTVRHDILNSTVQKIEGCKNCDYKYICGGGCRALSYNVYGRFDHRLDFLCDHFLTDAICRLNRINFLASE